MHDDDELDQLYCTAAEAEPESDRGNDSSSVNASQVHIPLFVTVGSPTNESLSGTGMALDVGNNEVRRTEGGGPCQRPALSSTQMGTVPNIIIEKVKSDLN